MSRFKVGDFVKFQNSHLGRVAQVSGATGNFYQLEGTCFGSPMREVLPNTFGEKDFWYAFDANLDPMTHDEVILLCEIMKWPLPPDILTPPVKLLEWEIGEYHRVTVIESPLIEEEKRPGLIEEKIDWSAHQDFMKGL